MCIVVDQYIEGGTAADMGDYLGRAKGLALQAMLDKARKQVRILKAGVKPGLTLAGVSPSRTEKRREGNT